MLHGRSRGHHDPTVPQSLVQETTVGDGGPAGAAQTFVATCARSLTHGGMRSLPCSIAPSPAPPSGPLGSSYWTRRIVLASDQCFSRP
jgi:hypothetical protein